MVVDSAQNRSPAQHDIDHWTRIAQEYDSLPLASEIHSASASAVLEALRKAGVTNEQMKTWNVLEVGGGTGAVTARLLPSFVSIHVIDTSPSMLTQLSLKYLSNPGLFATCSHSVLSLGPGVLEEVRRERPSPIVGDEQRKRKMDKTEFDLVVGTLMLHHVEDVESFMKGVRELVKPGGYVVFQEFEISEEQEKINESAPHHHHHHHGGQHHSDHSPHRESESSPIHHPNPPKGAPQGASAKPGVSAKTLAIILANAGLDTDIRVETFGKIPRPFRQGEESGNLIGLGRKIA